MQRSKKEPVFKTLRTPALPSGVFERCLLDEQFVYIRAMQQIALAAVLSPDVDAVYRRIYRWYSKNFHTPLHEVMKLSEHDVLLAYFE